MRVRIQKSALGGTVTAPPSKSMAHRALICAALAKGESTVTNVAFSQDIAATVRALRAFGAQIEQSGGEVTVRGGALRAPSAPVDCGESGSTLRFLIPLAALLGEPVVFTGHGRLLQRPQTVYERLFASCGVSFEHTPQAIRVCGRLAPGRYRVAGDVSSQFITGLLLALSLLDGPSELAVTGAFESASYAALTASSMADFGVPVRREGQTFFLAGGAGYRPREYRVEGDWSQAAFFAVLGAAVGGVGVAGLRADSLQGDRAILAILRRAGARIACEDGVYRFEKSALRGGEIDLADCPDLGPVLMALGLLCAGETHIIHARRLRLKESDRIGAMEQEIRRMGGCIASGEDDVTVAGGALHGAALQAHGDHRVAMAMAVAALASGAEATIDGAEAVEKSYGDFWRDLRALGAEVTQDGTA